MKPSTPNQSGELESCSTSQPCATACIQVPVFERNAPDQKSRKFLCRSARNISLTPRPFPLLTLSSVDTHNLIPCPPLSAKRAPRLSNVECLVDLLASYCSSALIFLQRIADIVSASGRSALSLCRRIAQCIRAVRSGGQDVRAPIRSEASRLLPVRSNSCSNPASGFDQSLGEISP